MTWEAGLKGTVLVQPGETVKIAVQFTARRGLFLVHCHNLEHEDVGMMANVMVECEAGRALSSHRAGPVAQPVRAADS